MNKLNIFLYNWFQITSKRYRTTAAAAAEYVALQNLRSCIFFYHADGDGRKCKTGISGKALSLPATTFGAIIHTPFGSR